MNMVVSDAKSSSIITTIWPNFFEKKSSKDLASTQYTKFLTQIRYRFLIPPRYKNSCLISSFVQSRRFTKFYKWSQYFRNVSHKLKVKKPVWKFFCLFLSSYSTKAEWEVNQSAITEIRRVYSQLFCFVICLPSTDVARRLDLISYINHRNDYFIKFSSCTTFTNIFK